MPEAERGSTRVQINPLVIRIGDLDRLILALVTVRVPNERCLPVVVQVRVCNRDGVDAMCEVEQAIVIVLVVVTVR